MKNTKGCKRSDAGSKKRGEHNEHNVVQKEHKDEWLGKKKERRKKRLEKRMHTYLRKQHADFSSTGERGYRYLPK